MASFTKGCILPKDLANRIRLSHVRYGLRLQALPKATQLEFDCRKLGWVTPVKDQKSCGSCWNFSGIGIAEMSTIVGGLGVAESTNWSEQSVLDCGNNGGCNGDWPETALEQAKKSGIANTSDYPYLGSVHSCKVVPHPNVIADYGYVGSQDGVPTVQSIKDAMQAHGPIACAVAADNAFMNYNGGIFQDSGSRQIDHAVILVGWKDIIPSLDQEPIQTTGGGYWIMRNSWGTGWGEQGYMRIAYNANRIGYGAMWAQTGNMPTPPPPVPPIPPVPPVPPTPIIAGKLVIDYVNRQIAAPAGWSLIARNDPSPSSNGDSAMIDTVLAAETADMNAVLHSCGNPIQIIRDIIALVTAFKGGNTLAILEALTKLVNDWQSKNTTVNFTTS